MTFDTRNLTPHLIYVVNQRSKVVEKSYESGFAFHEILYVGEKSAATFVVLLKKIAVLN